MRQWKHLDLRKTDLRPAVGELVALHFVPNSDRATFGKRERYDIGCFEHDRGGKKLWWRGASGITDMSRLKQNYDVWWCRVPTFDGF